MPPTTPNFDHLLRQILVRRGFLNRMHQDTSRSLCEAGKPSGRIVGYASHTDVTVTRLSYKQECMPHSEPGFIGVQAKSERVPPLAELLLDGYQLIPFEGNDHIFTDDQDRVIMARLTFPQQVAEAGLNDAFVNDMKSAQSSLNFLAGNTTTRDDCNRGDFSTISVGISHGGGQKEPRNLNHTASNAAVLCQLERSKAIQCIGTWQNRCYKTWMPGLAARSDATLTALEDWNPALQRNFNDTVFGSITYNFGPFVVCDFHLDHLNWAAGMCAVTSGGSYDYKNGGHLVLKEVKLILEFPPCTTILMPSAGIKHGNLPIQLGETRISVTQYTAGGLVRWVDYGFKTSGEFNKSKSNASDPDDSIDGKGRWAEFMDLYSKLSDFTI